MPELPEIETIRRSLVINIGASITRIDVRRSDIIRREDFPVEKLCGQPITDIQRRGKYLNILLGNGLHLVVHLGMSGRFYTLTEAEEASAPHVHFIIHLDNGHKLLYQDARRFGGIWLCTDTDKIFALMGVEPLSKQFTAGYLAKITENRKVAIKTLLLNQQLISGIGNIYADESLFAAGIRGERPASSLTEVEIKRLHEAIVKVLKKSIEERGTTFRDYRDGFNRSGNFQNSLQVYGRDKQACNLCGQIIKKIQIGGRSSHFCENCQK
jgi:formamidopyrimidine-DNA glycosylase